MLEELKNLEYRGGKDGLLFLICDVIGSNSIRMIDAKTICTHSSKNHHLSFENLINYCLALGWIKISSDVVCLSSNFVALLKNKEKLNDELIASTISQLFAESAIDSSMFYYDTIQCCYAFRNELFPLSLATVRNVLISQGFLIPLRNPQGAHFYISPRYEPLIIKYCKEKRKQLSLNQLKKQLEDNELAGERAEVYVLEYERKRLEPSLRKRVKRISEIDVTAGYDIISFDSNQSLEPDRFIEVKAVSSTGFYWSKNEYRISKLKGDTYYLYLVDLGKISQPNYSPQIIQNPARSIMETDRWFVEAQSYFIKPV